QVDTPQNAYTTPQTPFVAGFLGAANIVDASIDRAAAQIILQDAIFPFPAECGSALHGDLTVAVKPENIILSRSAEGGAVEGEVQSVEYQGFLVSLRISVATLMLRSVALASAFPSIPAAGDRVFLTIDWPRCSFFDKRQ
ncbi:MAG: TOBE domain-containing protein, partial [Ignavibacteria bacterium]|nr:TOBE domain-containing protein [Ignavibacteria bacterium]